MSETAIENQMRQRCKPEVFDSKTQTWDDIKYDVLRIEQEQFGEKAFEENEFKEAFDNPETTAVLLRDLGTGSVIGFTYALPAETSYDESFYPERVDQIRSLDAKVAYIEDTVIDPKFTGHGLVGSLIAALEESLKEKGYGYIDRDSAVKNNYAANIEKVYKDRVVTSYPHPSIYGDQVFFRIRL